MIVRYNDEKMVYESIFSRVPDPKVLEEIDYEVSGWDQASDKFVKKYVRLMDEQVDKEAAAGKKLAEIINKDRTRENVKLWKQLVASNKHIKSGRKKLHKMKAKKIPRVKKYLDDLLQVSNGIIAAINKL